MQKQALAYPDQSAPAAITGPSGRPITVNDLPPPNTKRWVVRRKAEVVAAVRAGILSLEDACDRYTLSIEEFASWQKLVEQYGVRGLRATRIQEYRGHGKADEAAKYR